MIDNRNREAETLGSVGPFVKITWNDAKYYSYDDDVKVVAELFEEWKQEWKKNDRQQEQRSGDTR